MSEPPSVVLFTGTRTRNVVAPLGSSDRVRILQTDRDRWLGRRYLDMLRAGRTAIRQRNPDLLVVNRDGPLAFVVALLGLVYRRPLVVRLGGDPWRCHWEKVWEHTIRLNLLSAVERLIVLLLNWMTFRHSSGFIVVSEELRETCRDRFPRKADRIRVVHSPAPVGPMSDGDMDAVDFEEGAVIATVTNLEFRGKYEGVRETIPEVASILRERENVTFVIAGDGLYYDDLVEFVDATVADPAVRDRIFLPGHVDDVGGIYATADVFLYLSHDDGYPNVILEAQAAGLPVITNCAFGMAEQIEDGETGRFVDPSTKGHLEETLRELLEDAGMRRRIGERARETVRSENDPAVIGEDYESVFVELWKRMR